MSPLQDVIARARSRDLRFGVVGLGYVGLPLVTVFADAGYHVTGFDVNQPRVDQLNRGESYIEDVPSAAIGALVQAGRFEATTDWSQLAAMDAISICVPTPLSKTFDPDLSFIIAATEQVARYLRPGQVIVLESTTYPGTTREIVLPPLSATGLTAGQDFFLAFSPERVDPGRTDFTTRNTPKVLGGMTPACLEAAVAVYASAIDTVVPVSSTEAAEMVKLLENTFRSVNIGLVNEILQACDKLGLDAWEVIDAAATKPFGFMRFVPGPGLGGHCIPIDPLYLSWKLKTLDFNARFIELASEVNGNMPRYWVQKTQDALNDAGLPLKGSAVLVLGAAYKKDVSDVRESPSIDIIGLLQAKGAVVSYHDPHVADLSHEGIDIRSVPDLDAALAGADCVVIATDHSAYDWGAIRDRARLVIDTRGILRSLPGASHD